MLTPSLLLAAVLCWPAGTAATRLRALREVRRSDRLAYPAGRFAAGAAVAACGLGGFWLLGVAGAVVGAMFGMAGAHRVRARRQARARVAAVRAVADALGGLVAELRAGRHPAVAAESVAADAPPDGEAAVGLRAIAAAARLGGDIDMALADTAGSGRPGSEALQRVARAWRLAQQHGLPLAEVLDAVRRDLDAGARFAGQLQAKLAGPRASAAVLAGLPAVGVLLGEAMGARPLDVLSSTPAGQVLLLLGGLLVFAGVGWSGRLTQRAVAAC